MGPGGGGAGGVSPKVKAAPEAALMVGVGGKLCLKTWPDFRDVKRRKEQFVMMHACHLSLRAMS